MVVISEALITQMLRDPGFYDAIPSFRSLMPTFMPAANMKRKRGCCGKKRHPNSGPIQSMKRRLFNEFLNKTGVVEQLRQYLKQRGHDSDSMVVYALIGNKHRKIEM